ncbi:probable inactive dual specificity protein phosphatase-like At4g18593 isoform X2 [Andrographis paniculata]|uniref:probable inactive dual specificity protein phosphatase-like At4g18593 isoform X2 n=1 Tax=Andrographis paniculata TaxID=175694 RepID=UPI0021E7DF53|nr:probable inactive dual specificity protein phosphatase-like At4g18593 isoform X2 [Andrographis paniculata]
MIKAMEPATDSIDSGSDPNPPLIYRCKKCRRIVATKDHIVAHERGEGQKCFKWKKRDDGFDRDSMPDCSSIFVEPMKWMQSVGEGCVEDKLQCIGCKARLGSFNWAGMQCSCGTWVNPAFQLHKSRLDESRV